MKQRIPNAIYNKEFREQGVKRVHDEGLSLEAVAKQLSMPKSTLVTWVRTSGRQAIRHWQDPTSTDRNGAGVGKG